MILAAATVFGFAACTVNELSPIETPVRTLRTFTCGFDEETKTSINRQGKTLWSEGDKILLTNGTESDTVIVDALYAGEKYCEFTTALEGTLYAVYPYNVCDSVTTEGKIIVNVPSTQNGTFGSANIACAVADDAARKISLRNVTSVLKFKVPAITDAPVVFASVNANENSLSGPVSVSFAGGDPVVEAVENGTYFSNVSVQVGGSAGDFYVSVIPGTYSAGFNLTAATLDLQHASETKATVSDKELKANDLFDLGKIGEDLKPMGGDGSAENPYQISTIGEMVVLAYTVNEGNSLKEKHLKLVADIAGVSLPVGTYDNKNGVYRAFQGEFDGNGKKVTLAMNNRLEGRGTGLFGYIKDSAYVHDLTVEGSVASVSNYTGAVAGVVNAGTGARFERVVNKANVTSSAAYVGGIAGYADSGSNSNLQFLSCENHGNVVSANSHVGGLIGYAKALTVKSGINTGTVEGTTNVGGITGYTYTSNLYDSKNSGSVSASASGGSFLGTTSGQYGKATWLAGAAGISAYGQNVYLKRCENSGSISGVNKTGGLVGSLYWGNVINCVNNGAVSVSQDAAGGIAGWIATQAMVYGCVNKGTITTTRYQAAGIAGNVQSWHANNAAMITIRNCHNEGEVVVTSGNAAGGIIGYTWVMNNVARVDVVSCTNKGYVHAPQHASGIVGCYGRYSNWSRLNIWNCENHGHIHANQGVGGIFGSALSYTKSQGVFIYNSLNAGNITYTDAAKKDPNAGGIAGYINNGSNGWLENCCNTGVVGPVAAEDGTVPAPVDGANVGGIIGYNATGQGHIYNMYSLEGKCPNLWGPASKAFQSHNNCTTFDAEGKLPDLVTVNNTPYATVLDALNAWVVVKGAYNGVDYLKWAAPNTFIYPSYTDEIDLGNGFDIENGGEI